MSGGDPAARKPRIRITSFGNKCQRVYVDSICIYEIFVHLGSNFILRSPPNVFQQRVRLLGAGMFTVFGLYLCMARVRSVHTWRRKEIPHSEQRSQTVIIFTWEGPISLPTFCCFKQEDPGSIQELATEHRV